MSVWIHTSLLLIRRVWLQRASGSLLVGTLLLWLGGQLAFAQPLTPPNTAASAAKTPAVAPAQRKWKDLTPAEQSALKPLQNDWHHIGPERQRKWLEISRSYATMTVPQQEALHARMGEWAKRSPSERAQARLNFANAKEASKSLTPEEKRAKWEAYQALTPEEKRKLAQEKPLPKSPALAVTPVPARKLATIPGPVPQSTGALPPKSPTNRSPKIAVSPDLLNQQTLLPQPGQPAPTH
jgi:hypothetical protein